MTEMTAWDNPPFGKAGNIEAGQEFNYAVWSANTVLSFHNVPWNSDYRDLVKYDTQAALDEYLETVQGPSFQTSSYAKANEPVRVNLPFNACYNYNYLRVYNPAEPIAGDVPRVFYYFIKDIRFLAPNTTELLIQLDVWQTFSRFMSFGNCYIERGHIGVANQNAFDDHGRTYLTVPEGLDCGNEYVTEYALEHTIATAADYSVLMAATTDILADPGDIDSPLLGTAKGSTFEGLPNGMGLFLFENKATFLSAMDYLSASPWVAQGITSIMVVPPIYNSLKSSNQEVFIGTSTNKVLRLMSAPAPGEQFSVPSFRQNFPLPERYQMLSKFRTYPYSVVEMTTYHGAPLVLKPECVATEALHARIAMHLAPPNPRISVYPLKYNGKRYPTDEIGETRDDLALADVHDDGTPMLNDRSEFMDFMTGIFDLPMFTIVNNGYLAYMASNRNSIAYQHQNAEWTQQRAMAGVQLGYNQATNQMNTNAQQGFINNNAMMQGASFGGNIARTRGEISAITGVAGGMTVGGARGGGSGMATAANGMIGAMGNLASGEMDYIQAMGMAGIENSKNMQNINLQRGNSAFMRDTNLDYGSFAAQGDYQNAIAGINARVQDAKLIQPTSSGQVGGEAFNLAAFKWGVFYKFKMIQPAVMAAIGEMWLRYGYAVNRFAQLDRLDVMTSFTYWKLRETYIASSAMPEGYKQTIRGIFEKGVTVWTNPADIGTIDIAENYPLIGVTL